MRFWMFVSIGLATAACEQKPQEQPIAAIEMVPEESRPKEAPLAAAAEAEVGEVPTPEDFEEEAREAITAENLESEVAALEKELE